MGGKETTVQLQSNNDQALDGALKALGVGIIASLVITVIVLIVAVIAVVMLIGVFLQGFSGGGW